MERERERVSPVSDDEHHVTLHCCLCCVNLYLLLFFRTPSSISGFRVTMTTLTMRLLPPCLIILTTCLCPTLTTFWPFTWKKERNNIQKDTERPWEMRTLLERLEVIIKRKKENISSMMQLCRHLDKEVSHSQTSSPSHASLVDRLKVLQCRKGWGGSELFYRGLSCKERIFK